MLILQAPQIRISDLLPLHLRFVGSKRNKRLPGGIVFFLKHFDFEVVIIDDVSSMRISLLVSCVPLFVSGEARLHIEVGPDSIEGYATLGISHLALNSTQTRMAGGAKIEREFGWEKEWSELNRVQFVRLVVSSMVFVWVRLTAQ